MILKDMNKEEAKEFLSRSPSLPIHRIKVGKIYIVYEHVLVRMDGKKELRVYVAQISEMNSQDMYFTVWDLDRAEGWFKRKLEWTKINRDWICRYVV